ncbi:MAG TPA: SDR family NAD(P)-dependent oxidoreductase [Spirochaetia bacterium]|nr:SDR family NAD(P)-dependent oxidoreductase [Spirochaetia bacterium]
MPSLDLAGKLVVVTGASSGLGREIARALAVDEKADVVVAARRRDRLESLKTEIESRCPSRVHVLTVDLESPDGPQALFDGATAVGEVFALVNCAGVTFYGRTLDAPADTTRRILAVDQLAVMQVTLLFLPGLLQRGSGGVLAVTSLYGLIPGPYQNVYSAAKHAVQAFMEGLAGEYRGRGLTISTFAAGGMATEMIRHAGLDRRHGADSFLFLDTARAARAAISSFKRGQLVRIHGVVYKMAALLARITSRRFGVWLSERIMRP